MSIEFIAVLLVIATVTPCFLVGWSFGRGVLSDSRSEFDRRFQALISGALVTLATWQLLNRFLNWLMVHP